MDVKGFYKFLKKSGKKEHVVNGLINQVKYFEEYLRGKTHPGLDSVTKNDIIEFGRVLSKSEIKHRMRGLALYYKFIHDHTLFRIASDLREKETSKTRKVFKLSGFRGVEDDVINKLEDYGIVNVEDMLSAGKTPDAREQLAEKLGISPDTILELVKLSDLSRLGAVKSVRARLYYDAGLDTPHKFAEWELEALQEKLEKFVKESGFDGIAPLPKELLNTIKKAHELPEVVEY